MATQKVSEIAQVIRILGPRDGDATGEYPMLTSASLGEYFKKNYFVQGYSLFNTHVLHIDKTTNYPAILYVLVREVDEPL